MEQIKQVKLQNPNPKQERFFKSHKRFIGYGGARGGGKSWAMRNKFILLAFNYSGLNILLLRKTLPELRENHILKGQAQQALPPTRHPHQHQKITTKRLKSKSKG